MTAKTFFILVLMITSVQYGPVLCAEHPAEWVEIQDPESGRITPALFCHPGPGAKLPAVIYNHGKIVEMAGYEGALQKGYDVADFVRALADERYAVIAPIRSAGTNFFFAPINRAVISYLKGRADIDSDNIGMIGFSKGGYMALEAASRMPVIKAVVAMSPARPREPLGETELARINAPVFITLGKRELNDEIGRTTSDKVVKVLERLGKNVEFKCDYDGDHQWFYKVRPEYWADIIGFLNRHLRGGDDRR